MYYYSISSPVGQSVDTREVLCINISLAVLVVSL